MSKITVEPLTEIKAELGEGPLWSVKEQAFYWIDVTQRKVFRYRFATKKTETFSISGMPGCIANREGGGIIAAFRTGPALISLETGQETKIPSSIDFGIERSVPLRAFAHFLVARLQMRREGRLAGGAARREQRGADHQDRVAVRP